MQLFCKGQGNVNFKRAITFDLKNKSQYCPSVKSKEPTCYMSVIATWSFVLISLLTDLNVPLQVSLWKQHGRATGFTILDKFKTLIPLELRRSEMLIIIFRTGSLESTF